jgi:hypothetical protein
MGWACGGCRSTKCHLPTFILEVSRMGGRRGHNISSILCMLGISG